MTDMNLVLTAIIALVNGKNWNELLLACSKLLNSGCLDARVLFFTGLSHRKLGNAAEGARYFSLALKADPNVDNAAYANTSNGVTYRRMATQSDGTIDQFMIQAAIGFFHRALQLDPDGRYGDHASSIAGCMALMGSLEQAVEWYNWALANGSNRPEECLYNKGIILNTLNRYEEAYETFRQLAERNPNHGRAQLWKAKIQLGSPIRVDASPAETIEAAIPSLEQSLEAATGGQESERFVYLIRPNQTAIVREDDEVESTMDELAEAHGLAAVAHVHLQDLTKAEAHMRASHSYSGNNPTLCHALWLCKEYGHPGSTELFTKLSGEFGRPTRGVSLGSVSAARIYVEEDDSGEIEIAPFGESSSDFDLEAYGQGAAEGESGSDFELNALDLGAEDSLFDQSLLNPSDSNIGVFQGDQGVENGLPSLGGSIHLGSTASGIGEAIAV